MHTLKKLINLINQDITNENESKSFTVVLRWFYLLLTVYFICYCLYCIVFSLYIGITAAAIWLPFIGIGLFLTYRLSSDRNFRIFTEILLSWAVISVLTYGLDCGSQHFVMPLLIMCFFSIHSSIMRKFCFMGVLILLRLFLFFYCQVYPPHVALTRGAGFALQILNTFFLFFSMGIVCLIFSTTIQQSERKLWIYNQKLETLASTDSLTGLPNRRHMMELIDNYVSSNPDAYFSVALGDIDFFKAVNDSRGHSCGDDVLKSIATLFTEMCGNKGHVCRWGGEEFFFFLPEMNLDAASSFISQINIAVSRHPLYDKQEIFHITMTFGVEESNYQSDIHELIRKADKKLYYGKEQGRDRVVF